VSTSDWWCSPPEIAKPLEEFFDGPVDFDPCSNDRSVIRARKALTTGGLVLPWRIAKPVNWGVYQNDPYSQAGIWTDKMLLEIKIGNVRELVRLSMLQPSCRWWGRMCNEPERNPRILVTRRLSFLDPDAIEAGQKRQSCRFEPALTYIGPRVEKFDAVFRHLTRWSAWGRS